MTTIDVKDLGYKELNDELRAADSVCTLAGCLGQRFIAAGMADKSIKIEGVPGNALGAYLNGATINVFANAQDAVGDTMNEGRIIIHGNIGDAAGYAMRGGEIYVKDNAGYRAGIHMKEYKEKKPVMVIGGITGSFLGEYQAGGVIIVLGLNKGDNRIVGNFPCTGMHGGKMYLRGDVSGIKFPSQVNATKATVEDIEAIKPYLDNYCKMFDCKIDDIMSEEFTVIAPDTGNPYRQMYVAN